LPGHGERGCEPYVSKIGSKIVLIDGSKLAELMVEFGVGVATDATYTVNRIDNDFFETIQILRVLFNYINLDTESGENSWHNHQRDVDTGGRPSLIICC
jgi:hypothetical protein